MTQKKNILKSLVTQILSAVKIFSFFEQPSTKISMHPDIANNLIENPVLIFQEMLSRFNGCLIDGRYWTVLYDPYLPFVFKISKRPFSRKSMARRATTDFNIIYKYLGKHVPWQCVFEAAQPKQDKTIILVQDLIMPTFSLGALNLCSTKPMTSFKNYILSQPALRDNLLHFIQCVNEMNEYTLAVPDLWGDANLVIHGDLVTLIDTNVLYSPAEENPKGREGYFAICFFLNELYRMLQQSRCLSFINVSQDIFSVEY